MKKKVALIYGGNSEEAEVSLKSGRNVSANIDREKYDVFEVVLRGGSWRVLNPGGEKMADSVAEAFLASAMASETAYNTGAGGANPALIQDKTGVEVDKGDFSFTWKGEKTKFDLAFIMIHGTPGENGLLQGYFEMLRIPYNTCSAVVSAITFDKHACKRFLDKAGIKLAKDVYLHKGESYSAEDIIEQLGLPLFVKPANGGSSFGITKVKEPAALGRAIELVFSVYDSVIIEEFIPGREMTNGIYRDGEGELVKLPVTEVITHREFFDYQAKYLGESDEVCPAKIPDEICSRIQEMSERIYKYMGCSGLVRMDYILKGEDIYFLELNTVPGMTMASLVPAQVRAAGIDMQAFFTTLLEGCN